MLSYKDGIYSTLSNEDILNVLSNISRYTVKNYDWSHVSTGLNTPFISFDENFPTFPESMWNKNFLLVSSAKVVSSVAVDTPIEHPTGYSFFNFKVNVPPKLDQLLIKSEPQVGTALVTQFSLSCGHNIEGKLPFSYSIGYLVANEELLISPSIQDASLLAARCNWIVLNCIN